MKNIYLIILEVLICYISLIFLYKKYKTDGIYVYGIIATLLSCIMSLKQIDIINISVPLGFGLTTSLIIGGNILTQKHGIESIKTYLILILITSLISCSFLNLTGLMKESDYIIFANKSYNSIFKYNLRVYLALIISLIISIYFESKLYYSLKRYQNKIVLSNILSIIIIELLDNILFVLIAYLFKYEIINIVLCIIIRYMIKVLIGILGTIPIYIAKKI